MHGTPPDPHLISSPHSPPPRWSGRCWHIHELLKYEFAIEFEVSVAGGGGRSCSNPFPSVPNCPYVSSPPPQIPVTYPNTAPEIAIPELDGKTAKMYRWVRGGGLLQGGLCWVLRRGLHLVGGAHLLAGVMRSFWEGF